MRSAKPRADPAPSESARRKALRRQLRRHAGALRKRHLRDLFAADPARAERLSIELPGLFIDYSKNILTHESLALLTGYAQSLDLGASIRAMFNGERINRSEDRAALHTALRRPPEETLIVDGRDVIKEAHAELGRIERFVKRIQTGAHRGWTGEKIDTFVNIGIGGSDLGPRLVVDALAGRRAGETRSCFISSIDYQQIARLKKSVRPESTLFIVSSKSFKTMETTTNAATLRAWMRALGCDRLDRHFVAVTNNEEAAAACGIARRNCFKIQDWVGGRFSLWSAIGLPIALALGMAGFRALLAGANRIDQHFRRAPLDRNAPVVLALIDYWYSYCFDIKTHAFIPYDESLRLLPEFLAQLFMESNGKSADISGAPVETDTAAIAWGATGTGAQHAFFQLLHQGTHTAPVDFLLPLQKQGAPARHALLYANCLAQSRALMLGEPSADCSRHCEGNKPSTTILYSELTPETLGALLALFEHRVFAQGLLWGINSFDQWGVESGKRLAKGVHRSLHEADNGAYDSSTRGLIERYRNRPAKGPQ